MRNLEQQLHEHASRIEAEVAPQLEARLRRAVARSKQKSPAPMPPRMVPRFAAGLAAGVVLAVAVFAVLQNRNAPEDPAVLASNAEPRIATIARLNDAMEFQRAPEAELEAELVRLNADWQRIRSRVRDQIDPLL